MMRLSKKARGPFLSLRFASLLFFVFFKLNIILNIIYKYKIKKENIWKDKALYKGRG